MTSDFDQLDAESRRILALSDEEVMAEHLALYDGDKELAQKSINMLRAKLEELLAKHWKQ